MVYPILLPQVDYDTLLGVAVRVLGKSPAAHLDEQRINLKKDLSAYLKILDTIRGTRSRTVSNSALMQSSFSFLVESDNTTIAILSLRLEGVVTNGFGIYHANLRDWRDAILDFLACENDLEMGLREVANQIVLYFEQMGIREIWPKKHMLTDGTFLLCQ